MVVFNCLKKDSEPDQVYLHRSNYYNIFVAPTD